MKSRTTIILGLAAVLCPLFASAVTIDLNGWHSLVSQWGGGWVYEVGNSGNHAYFSSAVGDIVTFPTLPNEDYYVDILHNSGATGSDFRFYTDAAGDVSSIVWSGVPDVATFSGDVITLNTIVVEVHDNGQNSGYGYYAPGQGIAYGTTGDFVGVMLVGGITVDMLHNASGHHACAPAISEDWRFVLNADATITADGIHAYSPEPGVLEFNTVPVTFSIGPKNYSPTPNWQDGYYRLVTSVYNYSYDFTYYLMPGPYLVNFWYSAPDTYVPFWVDYDPGTGTVDAGVGKICPGSPAIDSFLVNTTLVTMDLSVPDPDNCADWVAEILATVCADNSTSPPASQQGLQAAVDGAVAANPPPASICREALAAALGN